ncbi:TonB-dependent receptor [Terriglobus sp. ADX1]|uniref:TonB-dependent receptor n=1 Tax=Terriglobus sp. ADX1 TaxID=2794063 RepID=UPI002FE6784E
MKKHFVRLALAAVTLAGAPVILSPSVLAQAISVNGGSIGGTITDPSGAAISGAGISITSTDTGFKKELTTDKSGYYQVGPLNPGNYTVTVTAAGFQTTTVTTVVRTGTATSGSYKLSVGQSSTEISVSAGDVQVNTDQVSVGGVITKQQIDTLPVNGRNFLDLAQIEPGVILQSGESFDPTKAGYSAISVDGVSGRTTRILLDGQDITDETVGTTIFNVSQGAISEFQLNRSNSDVSGDVTSTGLVLVSTNSGTNALHGQLFYNFQDHRAGYALTKNAVDVPFQRNQFGGSIGGPIIKDKLFFFGNAERIKQDSSAASPVSTGASALFNAVAAQYPAIPSPYRETYSTARLDYNGPFGGHYFVRGNYNVNSVASNYGYGYWLYANRDNTPGIAGGADFATGKFTHSFRVSYEKFHNLISDATAGNSSVYNPLPGFAFYNSAQGLYAGPNYLAPQGTFQSDKQFRYDGSWTRGSHNVRFGYSLNRILGGGFAAFFGLSPRASESLSTQLANCGGASGAAACPTDPINGYHVGTVYIGNGQGYFTENSGFNLPGGGVGDWRSGAYLSDNWKITPNFTLVAGVRWSVDTGRANQDINLPTCADLDTSAFTSGTNPCAGLAGTTGLLSLWQSNLGATRVHQPWTNFGPQIGFNYAPGNHKTVLSAGYGIYYEGDVFNNTTNARNALLKSGAFFDDRSVCSGSYAVKFPDGSTVTSVNGTSIQNICTTLSVKQAAPLLVQLQQNYQSVTKANASLANGAYLGETLNASGIYAQPYRTPYSQQFNASIQREVFKNATLAANYVHQSTIKIPLQTDLNHIGAARYLNSTAATNAIAATAQAFGCTGAGTATANAQCAINNGAMIGDFAAEGLDGGANYLGGYPVGNIGGTPAFGAAFPGANPLLGSGAVILPQGRSGYDALQLVFRENATHPAPGIQSANVQVSYNLSRVMNMGTGVGTQSDQFFNNTAVDNDNPTQFMGRNGLDHKHQVNFGGSATLKYGPRVGFIGHFYSAAPGTLYLDSTTSDGTANGGIFLSDITGDGTTGDIAPKTGVGSYMHQIQPKNFNSYVSTFNSTYAGTLTPAGKALVNAGLVTNAQMTAMGATIQQIATPASATPIGNPAFRSLDLNFAYPIRFSRLREGLSLEPSVVFYNVMNFSNFGNATSTTTTLINANTAGGSTVTSSGYLQSPNTYAALNNGRTQRGSGTFSVGAPRTTEFQLKLNF